MAAVLFGGHAQAGCDQPAVAPEVAAEVTADGRPPERRLPPTQRSTHRPLGAAALGVVPGLGHLHTCDAQAGWGQGLTSAGLVGTADGLGGVLPEPVRLLAGFSGRNLAWYAAYDAYRLTKLQRGPVAGATTVDGGSLGSLARDPFRLENLRSPLTLGASGVALALVGLYAAGDDTPWPDSVSWGGQPRRVGPPLVARTAWNGAIVESVAISEEALFRGVVQPWLVDTTQRPGLAIAGASAAFGAAHLNPNRFPESAIQAVWVGLFSVPAGISAHRAGYDLGRPIAAHFWYDMILLTGTALVSPEQPPWKLAFTIPI